MDALLGVALLSLPFSSTRFCDVGMSGTSDYLIAGAVSGQAEPASDARRCACSPSLSDQLARSTSEFNIEEVAEEIAEVARA
jgi:hypothetical protein